MKRRWTLLACALIALLVGRCDLFGENDDGGGGVLTPEPPGLLAFTVFYEGLDRARIAVAPFDTLSRYRFVTDAEVYRSKPLFSPDKSHLLYRIGRLSYHTFYSELSAETERQVIRKLTPDLTSEVNAFEYVWAPDETGFYYEPFSDIPSFRTIHYGFADSLSSFITDYGLPRAFIGEDTLLVLSRGASGQEIPGLFFYLLSRDELERVRNPMLEQVLEPREQTRFVEGVDWDAGRRRLAVSITVPGARTSQIAITDLEGTVFETYTSGDFIDDHPRWGPGNTVLFDRVAANTSTGIIGLRVMLLEVETGAVRELLPPGAVPGAVGIGWADY